MRKNVLPLAVLSFIVVMMFAACSGQKGAAETAVKAAEDLFNSSKPEAARYLPVQAQTMENALAAMKDKLTAGDYKTVIADATAFTMQAKGLSDAAKAKKEELTATWTDLNAVLPKMIEAIQSQVDNPGSKKAPVNLTKENREEVMSALSVSKQDWTRAQESYTAGNLLEAVSIANSVKMNAIKASEILGLPVRGNVS
jgi:hypothetical protein